MLEGHKFSGAKWDCKPNSTSCAVLQQSVRSATAQLVLCLATHCVVGYHTTNMSSWRVFGSLDDSRHAMLCTEQLWSEQSDGTEHNLC